MMEMMPQQIKTLAEPMSFKYTVRFDKELTAPENFQEELYTIRSAREGDTLHILINSCGGRLDTAKAILSAIQQSQAYVITEIEGECASAATLIFLAGHEYLVSDDAEFMIHTASFGAIGKENNVRQQVEFIAKSNEKLLKKYYKDFLTEEEIAQCLEGKDFWMDADEIMERLGVRIKSMVPSEEDEVTNALQALGLEDVPPREELQTWSNEQLIDYILGEDAVEEEKCPTEEIQALLSKLEDGLKKEKVSFEEIQNVLVNVKGHLETFSEVLNKNTNTFEITMKGVEGNMNKRPCGKVEFLIEDWKLPEGEDYYIIINSDGTISDNGTEEPFLKFEEACGTVEYYEAVAEGLELAYKEGSSVKDLCEILDDEVKKIVDDMNK